MDNKKTVVDDIMDAGSGPVAYIRRRHGRTYQAVCPWCGKKIGSEIWNKMVFQDKSWNLTVGELYLRLWGATVRHMERGCPNGKVLAEADNMVVVLKNGTKGYMEPRSNN